MLDYKQAQEIRAKYPRDITNPQMWEIINIWVEKGIERVDMLGFSALYNMKDYGKSSLCDFTLARTAEAHFHYLEFLDTQNDAKKRWAGLLLNAYVENLTAYNDSWEAKKQGKKKLKVCKDVAKNLVEKVYALYPDGVREGFRDIFEIKEKSRSHWDSEPDEWQKEIEEMMMEYLHTTKHTTNF